MKTTYYLHLAAPDGVTKTLGKCASIADGREKAERHDVPKNARSWVGEYRRGELVTMHEL
jgi:hypothetical protein